MFANPPLNLSSISYKQGLDVDRNVSVVLSAVGSFVYNVIKEKAS